MDHARADADEFPRYQDISYHGFVVSLVSSPPLMTLTDEPPTAESSSDPLVKSYKPLALSPSMASFESFRG